MQEGRRRLDRRCRQPRLATDGSGGEGKEEARCLRPGSFPSVERDADRVARTARRRENYRRLNRPVNHIYPDAKNKRGRLNGKEGAGPTQSAPSPLSPGRFYED